MLKDSLVTARHNEDNRASFEHEMVPELPPSSRIEITPMPASIGCLVTEQGRIELLEPGFPKDLDPLGLVIEDGYLMPASVDLRAAWFHALGRVRQSGEAQFFALTQQPKLESVGIAPQPGGQLVAVRLPRSRMCSPDSVTRYAKLIGLTPRETCVLDFLTQGYAPASVAAELSTRESTVRTQIKSVLAKSNHNSMRGLLVTLACLPGLSAVAPFKSSHADVATARSHEAQVIRQPG